MPFHLHSSHKPKTNQLSPSTEPVLTVYRGGHWNGLGPSSYGDERFAFTLVLARKGHRPRRIEGSPIIWKWMFWADGRQVVYETGPLHFGMSCVLADAKTGRQLEILDCYHKLPANVPAWVSALNP